MKKYLALLFIIASPLMGQETEKQDNKKDLYIETGIFTRIEGVQSGFDIKDPTPVSLTALEFSVGKKHIYFYSQLRFSTTLPNWQDTYPSDSTVMVEDIEVYYGRRIGFLVGIGGTIYDSNPTSDSKKFTMHMNFAVGGDFALDRYITRDESGWGSPYADALILQPYYTIELNWMTKYYVNKNFGIQFGFNLALSGTDLSGEYVYNIDYSSSDFSAIITRKEFNIRYGFSVGFVF